MVNIKFSKNQEMKDLLWLYSEAAFFAKMPYDVFYPAIPENIVKALEKNQQDQQKLLELDEKFTPIFEQEVKTYQETIILIKDRWKKIEKPFFDYMEKNIGCLDSYECYISRYGPGGTFYAPSTISIRARLDKADDMEKATEKIAHEIAHLCMNDLIIKNKIQFEDTERMVDLILTKSPIKDLLSSPKMQNFGNPKLDEIFINNNFNIKSTIEKFSALR